MKPRLLALVLVLLLLPAGAGAQYTTLQPDAVNGTNTQVSCGTSATLALAANGRRRSSSLVTPATNSATVFSGFNSSLTTANGIAVSAGAAVNDNTYVGAYYCIVAAGTQTLAVGETFR